MKTYNHINYFDLGLGPEPSELNFMVNIILPNYKNITYKAYGIEAHPKYVETAKSIFSNNENVSIHNLAISDKEGVEKLYLDANTHDGGLGNSIFQTKNTVSKNKYYDVKSDTFSSFLIKNNINLENSLNILKVNIEGAELYLWEDFKKNNLRPKFQILCGYKSHDVYKVSELKDKYEYYNLLINELNVELIHFCHYGGIDRAVNSMKSELKKFIQHEY